MPVCIAGETATRLPSPPLPCPFLSPRFPPLLFLFCSHPLTIAACVASRPGQSGRCDGYILEGKELEFYLRKLRSKKGK